jgi:hypothetical protein
MQRTTHYRGIGLLLGAMLAGLGLLGLVAGAGASTPLPLAAPIITDQFHHLSGVLLYPPDRMRADQPLSGWAGPLTLPSFGPNVSASLNNTGAQNETTIAINPEDDQRLIASANDYRCNLCPYVYLSTNGGANWTNYPVAGASSSLLYGDPAMAFGAGGNAYFGYLGYAGTLCSGQGGMYVSRSTDAGASFSPPTQLAANNPGGAYAILQDKEFVAVDNVSGSPNNGNVYEGWTRYAFQAGANCGMASSQVDASVILSRSTDHGLSWSVPITASPPISNNNSATLPAVGRHGEVYLYYVGAQTQSQLNYDSVLFSRSTDGGQTFPFFTHIASMVDLPSPLPHTSFRDNGFGALAVDQQVDGYLYAVWGDYRTGDADILFSRSTDNGATWSAPLRVNDDPVGNGKDQFFPWIATAPDGRVHISWFDRREDPNDANYKEYYTDSLDRGLTFEPNVAVSTAPSVPGNSTFIGDYSGIAASTGVVIPIWTDIRAGGNQDAYIARGVYTGTIATPTAMPSNTPTATTTPSCASVWTSQAPYPIPIYDEAVVSIGDTLYSMGGTTTSGVTAAAYRYDPIANTWSPLPLMPVALTGASALGYNGQIYVFNGADSTGTPTHALLLYNLATNSWSLPPPPGVSTWRQAAALLGTQFFRIGGCTTAAPCNPTSSVGWLAGTLAPLPQPLAQEMAVALGSYVYVAGGSGTSGPSNKTYRYDPVSDSWDDGAIADLPDTRLGAAGDILNGQWVLAGGGADPASADAWDPASNSWHALPPLLYGRTNTAGASARGAFYLIGGLNGNQPTTDTQRYQPAGSGCSTPTASPTAVPSSTPTAVPSSTPTTVASATSTPVPPTATPTLCPITFSDVHTTDYFYEPVRYLYCHGVISGYGDNTFRPYNDTTRAQMVKIVVLGFGYAIQTPAAGAYTFHDVPPTAPFWDVIETAAVHNIVSGYGCGPGGPGPCDDHNRGYFLPNNPVTRGQLSKIDVIAAGWAQLNPSTPTFTDVPPASVFYTVIETAVCHGVVSGYADHTFHPFANATRGQISKIVYLSITAGGSCSPPAASR